MATKQPPPFYASVVSARLPDRRTPKSPTSEQQTSEFFEKLGGLLQPWMLTQCAFLHPLARLSPSALPIIHMAHRASDDMLDLHFVIFSKGVELDPYRDLKTIGTINLWTKDNDPQYVQ